MNINLNMVAALGTKISRSATNKFPALAMANALLSSRSSALPTDRPSLAALAALGANGGWINSASYPAGVFIITKDGQLGTFTLASASVGISENWYVITAAGSWANVTPYVLGRLTGPFSASGLATSRVSDILEIGLSSYGAPLNAIDAKVTGGFIEDSISITSSGPQIQSSAVLADLVLPASPLSVAKQFLPNSTFSTLKMTRLAPSGGTLGYTDVDGIWADTAFDQAFPVGTTTMRVISTLSVNLSIQVDDTLATPNTDLTKVAYVCFGVPATSLISVNGTTGATRMSVPYTADTNQTTSNGLFAMPIQRIAASSVGQPYVNSGTSGELLVLTDSAMASPNKYYGALTAGIKFSPIVQAPMAQIVPMLASFPVASQPVA